MKYLFLLLLLAGCQNMPGQSQMTAEQLKAVAADKNFSAVCSNVQGAWGTGKFVYANVDKSVVINGTISVDSNCVITMTNDSFKPVLVPVSPAPIVTPAPR